MAHSNTATADLGDRRKSERAQVDEVAFVSVAGSSTRCRVVNLSGEGAAINVPDAVHIPSRFQLMMESDRSVRNCRIAWIKQNEIGVEFERTIDIPVRITHRERQFMQYLRGGGWRRAACLPDSTKLISGLLAKGWIEQSGSCADVAYRITPAGLAAKTAPINFGRTTDGRCLGVVTRTKDAGARPRTRLQPSSGSRRACQPVRSLNNIRPADLELKQIEMESVYKVPRSMKQIAAFPLSECAGRAPKYPISSHEKSRRQGQPTTASPRYVHGFAPHAHPKTDNGRSRLN
jgi:hypothetical protein